MRASRASMVVVVAILLGIACNRSRIEIEVKNQSSSDIQKLELLSNRGVKQTARLSIGDVHRFTEDIKEDGAIGIRATFSNGKSVENAGDYVTPNMPMVIRFVIHDDRVEMTGGER